MFYWKKLEDYGVHRIAVVVLEGNLLLVFVFGFWLSFAIAQFLVMLRICVCYRGRTLYNLCHMTVIFCTPCSFFASSFYFRVS